MVINNLITLPNIPSFSIISTVICSVTTGVSYYCIIIE
jgi:hypothetical protein